MMFFFNDPQILGYNIIIVHKPQRNLEFFTIYHSHKNIFQLIYINHGSIKIYLYINKRLTIFSKNTTHHNPDLYTIYLEIHSIGKFFIHTIYNLVSLINTQFRQLPKLKQALPLFPLDKHCILNNFNLHHLVWGGMKAKNVDLIYYKNLVF